MRIEGVVEVGKIKITILPDRCQGGTVLKAGQMKMMIHRRLLHDDARGVN